MQRKHGVKSLQRRALICYSDYLKRQALVQFFNNFAKTLDQRSRGGIKGGIKSAIQLRVSELGCSTLTKTYEARGESGTMSCVYVCE
jgi:hypothetical protein